MKHVGICYVGICFVGICFVAICFVGICLVGICFVGIFCTGICFFSPLLLLKDQWLSWRRLLLRLVRRLGVGAGAWPHLLMPP